MKNWYKLRGVAYSTNFNFFYHNQIRIDKSGSNYKFYSSLEDKLFLEKNSTFNDGTYSETEIKITCRFIHANLLGGEFGDGILTD